MATATTAEDVWESLENLPRPNALYGVAADFFEEQGLRETAAGLRYFATHKNVPVGHTVSLSGSAFVAHWDGNFWRDQRRPVRSTVFQVLNEYESIPGFTYPFHRDDFSAFGSRLLRG